MPTGTAAAFMMRPTTTPSASTSKLSSFRMSPSHVRKQGIRYRYYVSSSLLHGQAERAGSVRRVPAAEIEALVGHAVREHLGDSTPTDDRDLISTHVVRVEVQADQLAVE